MLLPRSRYLRWIPPLGWMALIFIGSTDVLSANHTSRIIEPFLRWLFHGTLAPQSVEDIHFLIRKAGHLCEYAVLSVLFWWALPPPVDASRSKWQRATLAVCMAAAFAASDEFHQSFISTRGASIRDVLIDSAGAILGISVMGMVRAAVQSVLRN